jgi:hypothetical protein
LSLVNKTNKDKTIKKGAPVMHLHNETLLDKIKRLYTEFFLAALHARIDQYHSYRHSHRHADLSDLLYDFIDEIVNDASNSLSVLDYKQMQLLDGELLAASNKLKCYKQDATNGDAQTLNNLSYHLLRNHWQGTDTHLAGKLQTCVWEHVHAAHRFARSGNGETGKLHADLAATAMKTLSHYMLADDYCDFLTEISCQIQSLKTAAAQNEALSKQ